MPSVWANVSTYHARLMDGYYAARAADLLALEDTCFGWQSEETEYREHQPALTFKTYLVGMRNR